jgi:hypothetical protein
MVAKNNISIKIFILLLCMNLNYSIINARTIELNTRSRLFSRINESYLASVLFYCCQKGDCQKQESKAIKSRFNSVSQNSSFREAEIDFVIMNCSNELSIAHDFGFSSFPTIMLFENGMPISGARITGFIHECDINALIENYLANEIDAIIHKKRKLRKQQQEAQLAAWAAWAPYWYGGYGCCRPCGWGFYGGWGRGCCW